MMAIERFRRSIAIYVFMASDRSHSVGDRSHSAGDRSHSAGDRSHSAGDRSHSAGDRLMKTGSKKNYNRLDELMIQTKR
jgi:hypothetical protein